MAQLPRLGKRELSLLLLFTCKLVFVRRGFLFLWIIGMGCVILLWHSLSLPYNYFKKSNWKAKIYRSNKFFGCIKRVFMRMEAGITVTAGCVRNVNCVTRKPVFGVSDHVRHKPGCTVTIEITDLTSSGIVLLI